MLQLQEDGYFQHTPSFSHYNMLAPFRGFKGKDPRPEH